MHKKQPILYIFSGLPASGKSTLSQKLAHHVSAVYLRIDTVEQAIKDLCSFKVEGEGYRLSYRVAADNLNLGLSVVADSCNPIELTRQEWEQVAKDANSTFINIEISCSNRKEHKNRVEKRKSTVANLELPTWTDVENREYLAWSTHLVEVDTAFKTVDESFNELIEKINQ